MPDEEKKPSASDEALDTLIDVVRSSKTSTKGKKGPGRWIGILVAITAVAIGLAIAYFKAWRKGREHAKLLHERDVRAEQAHAAHIDAKLATLAGKKQAAVSEAERHLDAVERLDEKLDEVEREHITTLAEIKALRSWDAIDSRLNR